MSTPDHYQPVPNEGDQIRHRVVVKLIHAGVPEAEWEPLDDDVLVSQLYRIAVRRGLAAADLMPD